MSAGPNRMRSILSWYFEANLLVRILAGLILGAAAGIVLGALAPGEGAGPETILGFAHFVGDLFIRLLRMIVVPVVLFSLIGGAATIAPAHLGRVGLKVVLYYLFTSAVAVAIGLILAMLMRPGQGFHVAADPGVEVAVREAPSLYNVALNIVPVNPIEALARGEILPVIFFAILFGIGVSLVKDSSNPKTARSAEVLFDVCVGAADTMYKIVSGVMQLAPFGVFALIAVVFAEQGARALGTLLLVTVTVYLGLACQFLVCYGGFLTVFGMGMASFLRRATQPMITAFVTRSSSGTLPVTLRTVEERMGVPRSIASFSLPLGATINMDGTAIYLGVCAAFIGFAVDRPLGLDQQLTVVATATLASIGTAGVPGQGAILLLMVLDAIGLPVLDGSGTAAAYAMILGIDALLDMGRTGLNVSGDMVGTAVVAKTEKVLDMSYWE